LNSQSDIAQVGAERIKIAEMFHSIQGEGKTVGASAVFVRLSFCGFNCKFCDSVKSWQQGRWFELDEMDAHFRDHAYYMRLKKGAHLVVTGGDPLIQQKALVAWFRRMEEFGQRVDRVYIEVETQGFLMPSDELASYVKQWNVSPKLSNSGIPREKRIQTDVLRWHSLRNSYFKFPIACREDLMEVDDIVRSVPLKRSRVFLMPVCSTREEHLSSSLMVVELAKLSGYMYSPRMQLVLYDKALGV
jgi:7-carboxy-7-deazaguanine synthase